MTFGSEDVPLKRADILWKQLEETALVVDQDEGELLELNPVAAEIWRLIDGKRTVGAIASEICGAFDVGERRANRDVVKFLKKLASLEYLEERR